MNIEVKLQLLDSHWGFSDLLDGRKLNDKTKLEVIEFIKEDIFHAFQSNDTIEITEKDIKTQKEAFKEFVENNKDACYADYESWHKGWESAVKYLNLTTHEKDNNIQK